MEIHMRLSSLQVMAYIPGAGRKGTLFCFGSPSSCSLRSILQQFRQEGHQTLFRLPYQDLHGQKTSPGLHYESFLFQSATSRLLVKREMLQKSFLCEWLCAKTCKSLACCEHWCNGCL